MNILDTLSVPNPSAVSVTAGLFGKFGTDQSILVASVGDSPDGVIQYTTDGAATLMYDGILPVTAGAVIAPGAEVMVDAAGKAVTRTAGSTAVGRYFAAANCAANDTIEIQFYRKGQYVVPNEKIATLAITGAALSAATTLGWANPEAAKILITHVLFDDTTVATGIASINIGTTAVSAATASDNLASGIDVHTAIGTFGRADQAGVNGKQAQPLAAGKWVTITQTAATTGLVGTLYIFYVLA